MPDRTDDFADTIKKLTKAQLRTLESIAIGLDHRVHPKCAATLLRLGLITAEQQIVPSWPTPATITRYSMPISVHMAWCSWCSDRFGNEVV